MSSPTPTAIPLLHSRYRIEEKLGTGRLAVVYRAYDERLQRKVLVHMLRKELMGQATLRQRFIDEAHASARRSHQSLLEVYDSGEIANRPYMVTEYVAGRTLRELGALSVEEALLYFRQVVGAVAVCQTAGVAHPPISSNNLVLVDEGHVELLENWMLSQQDIAIDIASYRAPERSDGGQITPASAVYALGLLLLEMLTGRRVITGTDPRAIVQAHTTNPIPKLSEVKPSVYLPALEKLLQRTTARDPNKRPQSAAALGQELDTLRRTVATDTRRLAQPPVRQPKVRQRISRAATDIRQRSQRQSGETAVMSPGPKPVALPPVSAPPVGPTPDDPFANQPDPRVGTKRRPVVGLGVMVAMFVLVGCLAYYAATQSVAWFQSAQSNAPSFAFGWNLPEWLTGIVSGGGEVLIVTSDGLNVREQPGLNAPIVGVFSSGALIRRLGGPEVADNIEWVRVRGKAFVNDNGQTAEREVEGWVSSKYVRQQ